MRRFAFSLLPNLLHLDLQQNPIQFIDSHAFRGITKVSFLHLESLQIATIENSAFHGLSSLSYLNISNNMITGLSSLVFNNLTNLVVLDISNNPLNVISQDIFSSLEKLTSLHTPEYRFCCEVPEHVVLCSPEGDEYSSCKDLLAYDTMPLITWGLAVIAVLGNLGVIYVRHKTGRRTPLSFLVQNLGIADLMMGIYLVIIGGADQHFRDRYFLHEKAWRSSPLCRIAGIISMLSSQMSVYVLTLIAADRLWVLWLGKEGFDGRSARVAVVGGWLAWILMSVLPVTNLGYFGSRGYIKHGICFLYNLTEGKVHGWIYATFIFIVHNLVALCFLMVAYIGSFVSIVRRGGLSGNVEAMVARKLMLVVLTDCICWIPPIVIGIMSLQGKRVDPQFAVWVAVFIFPVNSALNPFLYTFSSMKCSSSDAEGYGAEDPTTEALDNTLTRRMTRQPVQSLREAKRSQRRTQNRKSVRQATLKRIKQRIADNTSEKSDISYSGTTAVSDWNGPHHDAGSDPVAQGGMSHMAVCQNVVLDDSQAGLQVSVQVDVSAQVPGPLSRDTDSVPSRTITRSCSLRMKSVTKLSGIVHQENEFQSKSEPSTP